MDSKNVVWTAFYMAHLKTVVMLGKYNMLVEVHDGEGPTTVVVTAVSFWVLATLQPEAVLSEHLGCEGYRLPLWHIMCRHEGVHSQGHSASPVKNPVSNHLITY